MLYEMIDASFFPVSQETEPEKWIEHRKSGIGGSDAGAIMGMNDYASPLTVYMQKKGIEGFSGNASTEWGHLLEDPIRQKTAKELDVQIETVPGCFRSKEHEFMNANIDGLIYIPENHVLVIDGKEASGLIGHEIKTSARGAGFSETEIPDSYYCQVQHYMSVTGLNWFVLTVFFLESKIGRHYLIQRDNAFIEKLIEAETDFWENNVLADKIPEPLGVDSESDYLEKIKLPANIVLDAETEKLIDEEKTIDSQIKELEKEKTELKNKIICKLVENSDGIEDADKTTAIAGKYRITYNNQVKKSIDSAALKKAGLYDSYAKETSFKVLRISEVKNV